MELLHLIIDYLVETIGTMGYIGIFLLMFLESSFFPFPSEVVMIPAGYLAFQGHMNLVVAIIAGIVGSVAGAWFNYWLAVHFGRSVLLKFMKEEKLAKMEKFFKSHGHISTFNGRLLPVFRQYISFPAGLAKMPAMQFTLYTAAGAGLWVTILTLLGYFLGSNQDLIEQYLKHITIGVVACVAALSIGYYFYHRKKA